MHLFRVCIWEPKDSGASVRYTKFLVTSDIPESCVDDDFVVNPPLPAHILVQRGMVEQGTESQGNSLGWWCSWYRRRPRAGKQD
jgi:hypothetical protein